MDESKLVFNIINYKTTSLTKVKVTFFFFKDDWEWTEENFPVQFYKDIGREMFPQILVD